MSISVLTSTKRVRSGTPVVWLIAGFPIWWALGIGAFCWIGAALCMGFILLRRRSIRAPKGFGWWAAFLAWVVISALAVLGPQHAIGVIWRLSLYLSVTIVFLYIYDQKESELSAERVAGALTLLWVATVAGGWLGLALPGVSFGTPFEQFLGEGMASNPFIRQLVHPQLSSVQVFLGYPVPRPQAPFPYANHWGSVLAVLTPVVIGYVSTPSGRRWMGPLTLIGLSAVVPLTFSLNRTAWASLAIGLFYGVCFVHPARRGKAIRNGLIAVAVITVGVIMSPLGGLLSDRAETGHSNEGRANLYQQSIQLAMESPFIGKGAPQTNVGHELAPKVGTQGHLWLVLVSQGFVGLILFLGWTVVLFRRSRLAVGTLQRWCHIPLVIFILQLPFYDMLPFQLCIVFITSALAMRSARDVLVAPMRTNSVDVLPSSTNVA
ncbi:MAG: O-antigen ligase domain-containing protein [Acidimicrobiia bacterium]|nr:O-antigen ligase domain-containing protein [Acidimicrobiia bacterium]